MDDHVDIVENDPDSGIQRRIGFVRANGVVKADWLDGRWNDELLPDEIAVFAGRTVTRHEPKKYLVALHLALGGRHIFATPAHRSGACRFDQEGCDAVEVAWVKVEDADDAGLYREQDVEDLVLRHQTRA